VKAGSLFSGIGAPELAAPDFDWRWCAEIDPFACALLARRFPQQRNLGDVTGIDPDAIEPVDLVVFGSPCQSFSVAGKRQGMADARGELVWTALDIIGGVRPAWIVFENVPGLLSSGAGRDFGAILGRWATSGMGSPAEYWTLSSSECPSAAAVCSLSAVLETGALPPRFYYTAASRRRMGRATGLSATPWRCRSCAGSSTASASRQGVGFPIPEGPSVKRRARIRARPRLKFRA